MSYIGRSPQLGVRTRFYYTATGGETSLSGADDNGNTLVFSDGTYVDVLLNGITLVAGVDYNTGTANTISGLAALTASDVAEIVVYDVFSVGDAVSKSNGGNFGGVVNFDAGANGEIGGTTPAAGSFTDMAFNSGYGSVATAYGCRAWVNFNGTGTVAIRESGNVSSITDNGTGDYTVNFATAMPDANYCVNATDNFYGIINHSTTFNTTSVGVVSRNISGTATDNSTISVSVFR